MLQVDMIPYASDALADAMQLAQTKSLNSYTFSDCLNYLNYAWSDIYNRVAMIDDGYYGKTMQLTEELTHLPKCVKNTIMVYAAQSPLDYNRFVYREAGTTDITSRGVYKMSGRDLYCKDVHRTKMWLYYVPACPQIFFTHHNHDPITYPWNVEKEVYDKAPAANQSGSYNMYKLQYRGHNPDAWTDWNGEILTNIEGWRLYKLNNSGNDIDVTEYFNKEYDPDTGGWTLRYLNCCYPYIFVTWESTFGHGPNGETLYLSGFYDKDMNWTTFNGFDYTGIKTNVKFIHTEFNDKTGMGVTLLNYNMKDANDPTKPACQTVGWTPDSRLKYPAPEMYRYLVARLADKFSALNESNIMGVQRELVEAKYAFEAFLECDKSAWKRIENVNPATIGDWL